MTEEIHFNDKQPFLHPFFGKTIVFTGALTTMTRTTAARLAISCGARGTTHCSWCGYSAHY